MIEKPIRASGAVVFWNVAKTDRERFTEHLERLGLSSFAPNEVTDYAALQHALARHIDEHTTKSDAKHGRDKTIERKRRREDGVEVVDVERGDAATKNYYTTDFAARVENGRVIVSSGYAPQSALQRHFDEAKTVLSSASIGKSLIGVVGHLGGVSLRDSGGVYWLPAEALDTWRQVAAAVEGAAIDGKASAVYCVRTQMDDDTLRAVRDALTTEVLQKASDIQAEIETGLGHDAMVNRREQAMRLLERVGDYEEILGTGLEMLKQVCKSVEATATHAAMALM